MINRKPTDEILGRLPVHFEGKHVYDIVTATDFSALPAELELLETASKKICIVTDSNVSELYLKEVEKLLAPSCRSLYTFIFPAGEHNKNLDTVQKLYQKLIEYQLDRNDLLVALGGGVVGDLCGFAAATYLRGISFIQLPTTLLSQVDSSIGGKTGVDFDSYKNMVGAFHMPKLVYTNIGTLKTLSDSQFSSGMGEVLKHGLIRDRAYYLWLYEYAEAVWRREPDALLSMVAVSNQIKRAVVEADPTEQGERMYLNFGHTLGHAIEKLKNFELLHGECVALGALAAMQLSVHRGLIEETELTRFRNLLTLYHIPTRVLGLEKADVIKATKNDKKMQSGAIQFILLKEVGQAFTDRTVTEAEMSTALDSIFA